MSGFYNYDTRGASPASQIITLERMVEERDAEIDRLRAEVEALRELVREAVEGRVEDVGDWNRRVRAALKAPK